MQKQLTKRARSSLYRVNVEKRFSAEKKTKTTHVGNQIFAFLDDNA